MSNDTLEMNVEPTQDTSMDVEEKNPELENENEEKKKELECQLFFALSKRVPKGLFYKIF